MFDQLILFYHNLPGFVRWVGDFTFSVIFLRGIVANEILQELRDRGFMRKGSLHRGISRVLKMLPRSDRRIAIFDHYKVHGQGSVLSCGQDKCIVFQQ